MVGVHVHTNCRPPPAAVCPHPDVVAVWGLERSCGSPCSLLQRARVSFYKIFCDVGRLRVSDGKASVLGPQNEQWLSTCVPQDPAGPWRDLGGSVGSRAQEDWARRAPLALGSQGPALKCVREEKRLSD